MICVIPMIGVIDDGFIFHQQDLHGRLNAA
jgi:hypothetical protein